MNYKLIFLLIFSIASLFRTLMINHFSGLTYDELYFWDIVAHNDFIGVIKQLALRDYHPFLYLFTLKAWIKLFGDSDVVMQFLSVIFSLGSTWSVYLIGKTYKNRTFGLILMGLFAISSIFIIQATTVRFYQMAQFFALLSILFSLKLIKKSSKKHFLGLIISSVLLIYTQTTGIIFVALNALTLFLYFYIYDKKNLLNIIKTYFCVFLFSILQLSLLLYQLFSSKQTFWSNPWEWNTGGANHDYVFFSIQSFLYPFTLFEVSSLIFTIFLIALISYAIYFAYKSKDKFLCFITLFFAFYILIYYLLQKFYLVPFGYNRNYYTFHYVLFFFVLYLWLLKFKRIFLILFIVFNLSILTASIIFKDYINGSSLETFGSISDYIQKNQFDNCLIFNLYGDSLIKKYNPDYKTFDLNADKMFTIKNWQSEINKVFNADFENMTINDKKDYFKKYILENKINKNHKQFYKNKLSELKKGEYFIVVSRLNSYYINSQLKKALQIKNLPYDISMSYFICAKLTQDTLSLANNDPSLKFTKETIVHSEWIVFVFKKVK